MGHQEVETDVLARCQAGDHEAFTSVVRVYGPMIHALALRMVRDPYEAEDLSQEIFLRMYRKISTFRGQSKFSTWLYQLGYYLILDFLKARKRETEVTDFPEDLEGVVAVDSSPREPRVVVTDLVNRLPLPYRTAIQLFYVDGYSLEEIGQITGTPVGTVKTHLARGRERLRALMVSV